MKKLAATFLIFVFISYIALYLAFLSIPAVDVYNETVPAGMVGEFKLLEGSTFDFISRNLLGKNGEIVTNLQKYDGSGDTLSESVGLLMEYCVLTGKKELFDREAAFLKSRMLVDESLVKWREGKMKANSNATIDDLRIIRALLDAHDKWGIKEYLDMAGFMQQGIYDRQVRGRDLSEFYDWASGKSRHATPLCYLDLYTIDRMSDFNKGWLAVEERAMSVIENGRISNNSPFYFKHFNYDTGGYSLDEEYRKDACVCLTYTLYTAMHLAEVNEETEFLGDWLKKEIKKGRLYAWYNPQTLKPANNIESTAVYALAAAYARKAGENELYSQLVGAMTNFMVTDKKSRYFGGFGDPKTGYFHSFDNLTALWALALADNY